ncbi:MAG: hypothetical protein V7735_13415 [Photobacterium frigidiphilum]|uniref:DUF7482 domain-containing protein n=1 Tax=Photobacterium frigidiphilum TaxID=264736 RepID=UPI0030022EA1
MKISLKCGQIATMMYLLPLVLTTVASGGEFNARDNGGLQIVRHETAGIVDLVPGAERGTITQPLFTGTIAPSGKKVLFVITDASDKDFAEMFGATRADSLDKAPEAAVEAAVFDNGNWVFYNDAGLVARFDPLTGEALPPVANPDYSPLKRFEWNGKTVTANVPFVKWGDGSGQQLLIDQGGCDPLIRSNPPSPFFVGNGPINGVDCSSETALERYKGGQVVAIDLEAMTVTMKLHRATYDHPDEIPYYTVFDASKAPPAGFMGVIHAPKLGNLGRFGDNDAVGRIAQFSNGVRLNTGGPNRYQQGITSYRGGQPQTYSPMWHITWVFFDCDEDGMFFQADRNIGEGATPVRGSGIPGFDPADPITFDPFQMDDKDVDCPDVAAQVTGNTDGIIESLGHLKALEGAGSVIQTEGPAGLRLDSPLQPPLIVNCPVPLTVR